MNFPVSYIRVYMLPLVLFQVPLLGKRFGANVAYEGSEPLMHAEVVKKIPSFDEIFTSILISTYYNSSCSCRSTDWIIPQMVLATLQHLNIVILRIVVQHVWVRHLID